MKDMGQCRQGDPLSGPTAMATLDTIGPYLLPQIISLLRKIARDMPLYLEEAETVSRAEKDRGMVEARPSHEEFGSPPADRAASQA